MLLGSQQIILVRVSTMSLFIAFKFQDLNIHSFKLISRRGVLEWRELLVEQLEVEHVLAC